MIQKANTTSKITSSWEEPSVPSEAKDAAKLKIKVSIENHHLYDKALKIYHSFLKIKPRKSNK